MNGELLTNAFKKLRARIKRPEGGDDEIADSLQEAFCRLWSKKPEISGDAHAENLLALTARNIRINNYRSNSRHPLTSIDTIEGTIPQDSDDEEISDIYSEVDRLVRKNLSERDREILYLRERFGWEFEDIAGKFSLSEGNVRLIVSRARKTVREVYRTNNNRK